MGFLLDVLFHVALEAIGGVVLLYAMSFCTHRVHQVAIWFVLALIFSIITVALIG